MNARERAEEAARVRATRESGVKRAIADKQRREENPKAVAEARRTARRLLGN